MSLQSWKKGMILLGTALLCTGCGAATPLELAVYDELTPYEVGSEEWHQAEMAAVAASHLEPVVIPGEIPEGTPYGKSAMEKAETAATAAGFRDDVVEAYPWNGLEEWEGSPLKPKLLGTDEGENTLRLMLTNATGMPITSLVLRQAGEREFSADYLSETEIFEDGGTRILCVPRADKQTRFDILLVMEGDMAAMIRGMVLMEMTEATLSLEGSELRMSYQMDPVSEEKSLQAGEGSVVPTRSGSSRATVCTADGVVTAKEAAARIEYDDPSYAKAKAVLDQIGYDMEAVFDWCSGMPYYGHGKKDMPETAETGTRWYANFGFDEYRGNCFVMAATFYTMADLLGYEPRQMCGWVPARRGGLTIHSWVEVDIDGQTYVCDPDFTYGTGRNGLMIQYGQPGTWGYVSYEEMTAEPVS